MPKTLSIGSVGPEVKELQNFLNMLPSLLPRLLPDGVFGTNTKNRGVEFQRQNFLTPDGVIGPMTWAKLLELIARIVPGVPSPTVPSPPGPSTAKREEVVKIAREEAGKGGVFAKLSGGSDPASRRTLRQGHEKLLKYFRVSAPSTSRPGETFFSEDAIKYLSTPGQLAPMPHWCGIFALWVLKSANLPVGNWKMGHGISSVAGIKQVFPKTNATKGDVGYVNNGFEHHFIIEDVVVENGVPTAVTVEGNGDPNSNFNFKKRSIASLHSVYSPF